MTSLSGDRDSENIKSNLFSSELDDGVRLQQLGSHEEAISAFSKVLELDPLNVDALIRRGESLRKLGLFDMSAEDFMTADEVNRSFKVSYVIT